MKEQKLTWFRKFLERKSGIVISAGKAYLVKSRLKPLLKKYNATDINALILKIKSQENSPLSHEAIDMMTTNETLFFRDQYPFDALKSVIFPEINQQRGTTSNIKVWSAASSRGQEAYSIAMMASEAMGNARSRVSITGTDLSGEAVAFAKRGVYSEIEVKRGVSPARLQKFFKEGDDAWIVNQDLKAMTSFYEGNLVDDGLVTQMRRFGPFDVVFLRNVLIYFNFDERKCVVDRIAKTMNKGGYLLTGAADLAEGNESKWERVSFQRQRLWKLL